MVYVLHGGPAAIGQAAPIAEGLSQDFRAIEPFQRGSGIEPLTVDCHIKDLDYLIDSKIDTQKPFIIGHSWGAMLALAYASSHPDKVHALILVGCGTFNIESRNRMNKVLSERLGEETQKLLNNFESKYPDPIKRLHVRFDLINKAYDFSPLETTNYESITESYDIKAHTETWNDMIRLQENGTYPNAFSIIKVPVLMLHGSYDPHPGSMIYDSLKPYIKNMEYIELDKCGHYPWKEKYAKSKFFSLMIDWMKNQN